MWRTTIWFIFANDCTCLYLTLDINTREKRQILESTEFLQSNETRRNSEFQDFAFFLLYRGHPLRALEACWWSWGVLWNPKDLWIPWESLEFRILHFSTSINIIILCTNSHSILCCGTFENQRRWQKMFFRIVWYLQNSNG